jgi:hypothetical protein
MDQCEAARSPQVDPPADVINRRRQDTGEQRSPQQAEQNGPIGADDGVESVGMTDLSNHCTLLAGPPAAGPFVHTTNTHTTIELHDRGSLIEHCNCACATKTPLLQSLGLQGWIAFGRVPALSPDVEQNRL